MNMFYVVKLPNSPEPERLRLFNNEEYCLCVGDIIECFIGTLEECNNFIKDKENS